MTAIVLVRHGETLWHTENRYTGSTDVAMTDRGRRQASDLAAWAAQAGLDGLWASPLSRARETAAAVAAATGLRPALDDRLRELDFGAGEGRTIAEMRDRFPDALDAFRADPVGDHLPGGEDPRRAAARAVECLVEIEDRRGDGRVLVVAHTTLIRLALCSLLGIPLQDYRRRFPSIRNCALTEIRLEAGQAALLQFNTPVEEAAALARARADGAPRSPERPVP